MNLECIIYGTLKNLYQLVKNFWIDFFREAERGTRAHLKGIKIFLAFCIVIFVIILGGFLKFTESSTFCGSVIRWTSTWNHGESLAIAMWPVPNVITSLV